MGTTKIEKNNDKADVKETAAVKAASAKDTAAAKTASAKKTAAKTSKTAPDNESSSAKAAPDKVAPTAKALSDKESPSAKTGSDKESPTLLETAIKSSEKKVASAKNTAAKTNVYVQYAQKEINTDKLLEEVKAAYTASENTAAINNIELYIKPEENVAYYVINGDSFGSILL